MSKKNSKVLKYWLHHHNMYESHVLRELNRHKITLDILLASEICDVRDMCKECRFGGIIKVKLLAALTNSNRVTKKAHLSGMMMSSEDEEDEDDMEENDEEEEDDDDDDEIDEVDEEEKAEMEIPSKKKKAGKQTMKGGKSREKKAARKVQQDEVAEPEKSNKKTAEKENKTSAKKQGEEQSKVVDLNKPSDKLGANNDKKETVQGKPKKKRKRIRVDL